MAEGLLTDQNRTYPPCYRISTIGLPESRAIQHLLQDQQHVGCVDDACRGTDRLKISVCNIQCSLWYQSECHALRHMVICHIHQSIVNIHRGQVSVRRRSRTRWVIHIRSDTELNTVPKAVTITIAQCRVGSV